MPEQSLVKLVAIVWSAAALVALFVGLPALLTAAGVEIDAGLIVNALAATGSLSAAAVALWVATSDRRKRQRELDAEDEAQAKLVVVSADRYRLGMLQGKQLCLTVSNRSPRAIVDVAFVELLVDGHEHLNLYPTSDPTLPAVIGGEDGEFIFAPAEQSENDPLYRALAGQWERRPGGGSDRIANPTIQATTKMTATVRWTDASGKTWQRRGSRPPTHQEKPLRISARPRPCHFPER